MASSKAPPFVLKFKGNKTFSAFTGASIAEEENLWALHSVVTKCSKVLEEGSRLENLAWRLWYLHSAVVSSKKDREEFKKVSRGVAENLNKDKGKTLVELPLPELNRSNSDRLASRVAEKSRTRRASGGGGEKPTMNSMMGSFVLDKTVGQTVGVSKRRDSLPTGGKKPTNLKNKSRPNSPGPSGLTRSSSSRSTMEEGRSRGRAPSRTELLMTPATTPATTQQPHPPPSQPAPTFISLPTSSSFAHSNQPPSSSFQPPAPPSSSQSFQSTPSYPTSSSFHPQNASFNFTQPPAPNSSANHISLSIHDIFELAHPSNPPPPPPISNSPSNPNNSVSTSRIDSNETRLEDILRGLNEGGNSSALDFTDLGLGWPTDYGGGGNSNPLDSSGTGGVLEAGFSFEDLFTNSGMTGIEPSSLDSNATLRPHLPAGGSSISTSAATASSVFSSSASPEEIKQQMLGVLAGSPFPQNDRVRRLSKAGEPFVGRDEAGMGVGTGSGSGSGTGGEDGTGMGGFGGEGGSPPKLNQTEAQRRRSSTSRKSSGTSSLGSRSPNKGKGRVSSANLSQPQDFVHPSSVSSFDHPSKRRRGSEVSSDYGASPAFISSPWTPSALPPAAIQLPASNLNSPWSSNVHTPSLELTTGFEGMGVGGGFLSTQHQTQSPGVVDGGNQWSTLGAGGGGGGGGSASEFSFAVPSSSSTKPPKSSKSQQPSPSIRPYHPNSSASAPLLRAKQRTSSHSSISSQSASGSSTPGTLTPYQAGFLSSFAPIQPCPSSTGPVRRSSESQSARHSSGVRATMQQNQAQQQQQAPSFSTPSSPNRRNAGLPGLSSSSSNFGAGFGGGDGGGMGGGGGGGTARPRLTLQEQLELAGMVPKSSKPSPPSWQQQSTDPPQHSFDFAMGSSPEFGGDASRGGGVGAKGVERSGVDFGNGGSGSQLGAVPEG